VVSIIGYSLTTGSGSSFLDSFFAFLLSFSFFGFFSFSGVSSLSSSATLTAFFFVLLLLGDSDLAGAGSTLSSAFELAGFFSYLRIYACHSSPVL